jgi:hypothetical protein
MFSSVLPEEIERMIWKCYFERHVLKEVREQTNIWSNPNDKLTMLCLESGCIQIGHTDFERLCIDTEPGGWVRDDCFNKVCGNCYKDNFPCANAVYYSNMSNKLREMWSLRHHYKHPYYDAIVD